MKDNFGREINYMRISVTDRCNLRCKYCMPEEGVENLGHDKILSFEDIARIVRASVGLGITKYRITGGEPLARKGVVSLVENLAKIEGVQELVKELTSGLIQEIMDAELEDELGYSKYDFKNKQTGNVVQGAGVLLGVGNDGELREKSFGGWRHILFQF